MKKYAISLALLSVVVIASLTPSCKISDTGKSESNELINPYAEMSLGEIIESKDSLYQILSRNNVDGFYYIGSTDSLFYFDYANKTDILVFTPDSASNVFKISVSTIKLDISDTGDIQIIKRNMGKRSGYHDELFCKLVKRARMATWADTERFFGKDGFIIDIEQNYGRTNWSRYYLVKPLGEGKIDAIVLPSGADCNAEIEFDPFKAHISCKFDLNQIPNAIRPVFENRLLTSALITNPLLEFYYGAELQLDGSLIQDENVDFGHIDYNMNKDLFKNKDELTAYLMQYEPEIIGELNKVIENFAIEHASPLQYFVDATKNRNEWKRMLGRTYYVNAVVDGVSEKRDYSGEYRITFGDHQLRNWIGSIHGYSTDERFENIHLPARLTLKATITESDNWAFDGIFKELEIVR